MKNIAIVLAGGIGNRMGLSMPKQFIPIGGKMVLEYSVAAFERHVRIDEIAIVSHHSYINEIENIIKRNTWNKIKKILPGGQERYHSSLAAIKAYADQEANLIFHDAARPLVSQRIISDVTTALCKYKAVDVALPSTDTLIEVNGDFIASIPDRSRFRRSQTPQAFYIETIQKAYNIAMRDPTFTATDDCGVIMKYLPGTPIYIVPGEEANMKLTYKEDIALIETFLRRVL